MSNKLFITYNACLKRGLFNEALLIKHAIRSKTFNLLKLDSLPWTALRAGVAVSSIEDKLSYAKSNLKFLGAGSSRAVFLLNSKKVLKIALNSFGIIQNTKEVEISEDFKDITTKIFKYSPKFEYLISELVRPISKDEFAKLIGYDGPGDPYQVLAKLINNIRNGARYDQHLLPSSLESITPKTIEFAESIDNFSTEASLNHYDLIYPDHWGKTTDGRLVLLDYGAPSDSL